MREVKLLQGTELQVLDQQAGRDKSCSRQGIVQTPDQQAGEPLATAEPLSLLLQEGDAGAEAVLSLDRQLREERSHQMSVELRPVGVDEVPALCQQPGQSGDLSLVQINRNTALLLIDKDTAQGIQSPSLGYFLPFAVSLWH